jgi:methanogenic corrinoid protein MtbC1
MRRLTLEGFPPAEAARLVAGGAAGSARLASVTPLREAADRTPPRRRARTGGGRIVGQPDGSPAARGLARAAMALDSHEMRRLLRESVTEIGVTRTWELLAAPVLIAIGERWARTGDSVDVEHALSEAMLGVLYGTVVPRPVPDSAATVLLACAEGDLHTLPLHVLAAALAEHRVRTRMLGYGMPADALVAAVRRSGPAVVFLFASLPVGQGAQVLEVLPRQRPAPQVMVGGLGWHGAVLPPSVRRVDSLTAAVDAIRAVIQL